MKCQWYNFPFHIIKPYYYWYEPLGTLPTKKNGIFWEFVPSVGPPPLPPFWEPVFSKKKVWFILHFRPLGAFLVFTKMFTFWSILLFKSFGNRWPPKKLPVFTFGNTGPPQNFHVSAYKKWNGKYKIVLGIAKTPPPFGKNSQKIPIFFGGSVP